jgi:epoxyqueuosine reductase QueG
LRVAHDPAIVGALQGQLEQGSALVREHAAWALAQQTDPQAPA